MTACRFHQVHKAYRSGFLFRKLPVLRGVSFEISRGETFAYLGHNGAGKTTTIKALLGLIGVDSGEVELLGHAPGHKAGLSRLGYLPENPYFYDHLSGRELLQLVADLHGLARREARSRIGEALELVGMADRADRRMRGYSKGMLQRVGLAQALLNDPELVILDEPMSGLDPMGRAQIRSIVQHLKSLGKTIFLSSHILADVEAVADRAAIVSGGELRRVVDLHELHGAREQMVLHCRHLPAEAAQALRDGGCTIEVEHELSRVAVPEPADLPSAVARVQASGARLLQVAPRRRSLEEIFLQELGDGPSAAGAIEDVLHFLSHQGQSHPDQDLPAASDESTGEVAR